MMIEQIKYFQKTIPVLVLSKCQDVQISAFYCADARNHHQGWTLSLVTIMDSVGWSKAGLETRCIEEILSHVVRDGDMVLETVSKEDGQEVGGVAGRMVNPGHVIECGWFLLDWANRFF